jgi:DNA-binding NtrC family response regulator
MKRIRILILEDIPNDAELLVSELRAAGFDPEVQLVDTETDYRAALASYPEIVFADFNLPNFSLQRALSLVRDNRFDIPLIIFSGTLDENSVTEYLKNGATDYVLKNHLARAGHVTHRALEEVRQRIEFLQLSDEHSRIQRIAAETGNPASGIASEFATLLTVIQGNADALVSDPGLNDNLRKSLSQMSSAAARAAKLATRLLPPKEETGFLAR